jgi:hypothetical protein
MTPFAPATRGPGGPHGAAYDLEDPLTTLAASARRLVEAAKHIILTERLGALTLGRVARVSGENKAMTAYNFGNKAGLVAAPQQFDGGGVDTTKGCLTWLRSTSPRSSGRASSPLPPACSCGRACALQGLGRRRCCPPTRQLGIAADAWAGRCATI